MPSSRGKTPLLLWVVLGHRLAVKLEGILLTMDIDMRGDQLPLCPLP